MRYAIYTAIILLFNILSIATVWISNNAGSISMKIVFTIVEVLVSIWLFICYLKGESK